MAIKIRLARYGAKKKPFYRIVAAESTRPRDGRFLEILGTYDPRKEDKKTVLNIDRLNYWLSKGAKPTETVSGLLRKRG